MREEARLMRHPSAWIAFGFGSGLSPFAPGTCGTAMAMPFYLLLAPLDWYWYALALVPLFALGVWTSDHMVERLGRQDPSAVVWDEMVGYWLTMLPVPGVHWQWMLLGFFVFRLFDIVKPWPIRGIDRDVGGGLGAMLDDAFAGVYSALVMAACVYWIGAL